MPQPAMNSSSPAFRAASAPYNLLALETSTERLSLAIRLGDDAFVREVHAGQRHSELALPLMFELLAEAGASLADMHAIAFGQGPGSFTGVRIACGLTQGLALGLGKPVVPVQTQMALAQHCGAEKVIVALDARMGEIYFAAYHRGDAASERPGDGMWTLEAAPALVNPAALPALCGDGWAAIGSAFDVPALNEALRGKYDSQIERVVHHALPSARDVAVIAARQLADSGIDSALPAGQAAPLYLRNNVALTIVEREALRLKKAAA